MPFFSPSKLAKACRKRAAEWEAEMADPLSELTWYGERKEYYVRQLTGLAGRLELTITGLVDPRKEANSQRVVNTKAYRDAKTKLEFCTGLRWDNEEQKLVHRDTADPA